MKRILPLALIFLCHSLIAQMVINEGSNRNYSVIADENGEYPDWIELYNAGNLTVHLLNYSLTDDSLVPAKWVFPNISLLPGEFRVIFCSGKDRKPVSGFINVINTGVYSAHVGWNTHTFTTPFHWDGVSNVLINTCSYSSTGYTTNSTFNQTPTLYPSTAFSFADGSPASCSAAYGTRVNQRPNMKLNGHVVGTGQIQNSPYDYIDVHMKLVSYDELQPEFEPVDTNNFLHTNFKISKSGETIYLYSPGQALVSKLFVNCNDLDNSTGSSPDASSDIFLFQKGTPSATNNLSDTYSGYLLAPVFSVPSGFYEDPVIVSMTNPNTEPCSIHYTIDGSEPNILSPSYTGEPVSILYSAVLKARALSWDVLPSPNTVLTYLFGASHTTPVLSVVTDNQNLYGPTGIFDNWMS